LISTRFGLATDIYGIDGLDHKGEAVMQRFDLVKQFCGIFGGLAALGDTGRSGETGIQSRQQTLDFGSFGEQFGEFFGGGHVILLGNGAFPWLRLQEDIRATLRYYFNFKDFFGTRKDRCKALIMATIRLTRVRPVDNQHTAPRSDRCRNLRVLVIDGAGGVTLFQKG